MKKLSIVFVLLILSATVSSQTTARPIVDVKDQPSTKKLLEELNQSNAGVASSAQVVVSEYYGLDNQIKTLMIDDRIPADFPKGSSDISKQEYISIANNWISKNKSYLKPQSQNEKLNDK